MTLEYFEIVGILTSVFSFASILGSCWIIRSAIKQRRRDKQNRKFLINEYVYYMSICDLLAQILTLIYFGSVLLNPEWRIVKIDWLCIFSGVIFQFSLVASATWSFAIATVLFRLINGTKARKIANDMISIFNIRLQSHHVIIWIVSIILTIIPLFEGAYGKTENYDHQNGQEYECWITDDRYQMLLYVPILIYLVLTLFILIWVPIKIFIMSRTERRPILGHNAYIRMDCIGNIETSEPIIGIEVEKRKIIAYTLVFWFIWIFPSINRLLGKKSPDFLKALHHILLSCIGLGNFIVWQVLFTITDSKQQENEQIEQFEQLVDEQQRADANV